MLIWCRADSVCSCTLPAPASRFMNPAAHVETLNQIETLTFYHPPFLCLNTHLEDLGTESFACLVYRASDICPASVFYRSPHQTLNPWHTPQLFLSFICKLVSDSSYFKPFIHSIQESQSSGPYLRNADVVCTFSGDIIL